MKRALAVAALLFTPSVFADAAPLTNTRYGPTRGVNQHVLRSNGRDLFLFWNTTGSDRVTKIADGSDRAGRGLMETRTANLDAAWTGDGFLFAGDRSASPPMFGFTIVGRRLDANAQPAGPEFTILDDAQRPRLAASPDVVVMLYTTYEGDGRMVLLSHAGAPLGAPTSLDSRSFTVPAIASSANGFAVVVPREHGTRVLLLDSKGQLVREQLIGLAESGYRDVAVAGHGSRYLIMTATYTQVAATLIDENGSAGTPLIIEDAPAPAVPRSMSVAWNGDGWSVAYDLHGTTIAHLTPGAERVVAKEKSGSGSVRRASLAEVGGRLTASWWNPETTASIVDVPLAGAAPRVATFGAIDQLLDAAAASSTGTLFAWREGISLRLGLRTHAGDWSEYAFGTYTGDSVLLASDGRGFALVVNTGGTTDVFFLDENGRVTRQAASYPALWNYTASSIVWSGTHYAITNGEDVRLLSPDGVLSAPVAVAMDVGGPRSIATNGNGFFLTAEKIACPFILCYSEGLHGVRLNAALERIDATDLVLADETADSAGVLWNGTDYVTAWQSGDGAFLAHVPASGGAIVSKRIDVDLGSEGRIAATTDGNLALLGNNVVAFASQSGAILRRDAIDAATTLVALPAGRALAAGSIVRIEPPFHGALHMMSTVAGADIPPPAPPHASLAVSDTRLSVAWTPASGSVNGYRLETRVDDGNWIELERWFGPGELGASIARPAAATAFAVRVRAFNDGGASEYSNIATSQPRRRRVR